MKPEIEHKLVIELAKGLQWVKIHHDTYIVDKSLDWLTSITAWIPAELQKKCGRFCGGSGFATFIDNEILRRLRGSNSYNTEQNVKPLTSFAEFSDSVSVAQDIVKVLTGLPYRYRVSVGLPIAFSKHIPESTQSFNLSSSLELCSAESLPDPFPVEADNQFLNTRLFDEFWFTDDYEVAVNGERYYLTLKTVGYSGTHGASLMARELEDNLRSFYGAGLALGLFTYEYVKDDKEPAIFLHREDEVGRPIISGVGLEADLWSNKEQLSTKKLASAKTKIDLELMLRKLSQIYVDDTFTNRLFTACIWYFRATFTKRALDKLLEATIAIEVILGDPQTPDGIGLTKLLGNRCAYMLGRTSAERDAIQKTFTELYKLRSSIVHAGKHRADQSEIKIVNEALVLCGRIIAFELRGLEQSARV